AGSPVWLHAQPMDIAEPFKVGSFLIDGKPTVGLVLRDSLIVDINAANLALERDPAFPVLPMPDDMLGLIERYEYGLQRRLYEIVNSMAANDMLNGEQPAWVHDLAEVD